MATDLTRLNEQQRNAVLESIGSNVVLLAAAGSGKTATIVKRTEYLIDDLNVKPENIMMITFTNKAAKEIVERVANITSDAYKMWIGTFHSICVRILRKYGHYMGINYFSIIDDKESKNILKQICLGLGKDLSNQGLKDIKAKISTYKSNLVKPEKVLTDYCSNNLEDTFVASAYREYQNQCWREKSFDFDDLIIYTIMLLSSYPEVIKWVHENIKYVMVDESQDTSTDQYQLIRLLAGQNNLMMVGDINQSIYRFRNARPEYLNDFCKLYPTAKMLKLETNYRSTKNIVMAANAVINHNSFGEKINMVSANEIGDKIGFKYFDGIIPGTNNEVAEAKWIASEIKLLVSNNKKSYEDFAIIYRTNIQSKDLEKVFFQSGIPYTVIGSSSFWSSKEMKDLLAFCKITFNPNDVSSFKRALSTIRGVGKTTIDKITNYMKNNNLKAYETLSHIALNNPTLYKVSSKSQIELDKLNKLLNYGYTTCSEVAKYVVDNTAYADDLRMSSSDEAQEKLEIINETIESFIQFENNGDDAGSVIDQISLMSDAKGAKKEELNAVKLMSAHSCKGLEFDTVFVSGTEEGLFPHWNSLKSSNPTKAVEEERRLFYVAITRAKKKLYLTACKKRKDQVVKLSRFVNEIPKELLEDCF